MLFNSTLFLTLFLPVCLAGFFVLGARSRLAAAWWLVLASLVFYAGWSWRYVPLLLGSVVPQFPVRHPNHGAAMRRGARRPRSACWARQWR